MYINGENFEPYSPDLDKRVILFRGKYHDTPRTKDGRWLSWDELLEKCRDMNKRYAVLL